MRPFIRFIFVVNNIYGIDIFMQKKNTIKLFSFARLEGLNSHEHKILETKILLSQAIGIVINHLKKLKLFI